MLYYSNLIVHYNILEHKQLNLKFVLTYYVKVFYETNGHGEGTPILGHRREVPQ